MILDAKIIAFAKENNISPKNLFYITERLISKEIYSIDKKMKAHLRHIMENSKNCKHILGKWYTLVKNKVYK